MALRASSYQLVVLAKMLCRSGGRVLCCDGVGVGKTISAGYCITWTMRSVGENVLIVCPVGLVDKWVNELADKFGLEVYRIRSAEELKTAEIESNRRPRARAYVLSYSQVERPPTFDIGLLVVDEIHNFRNKETKSWRHLYEISRSAHRRLGLSATPINNSPQDLYSIFALLYSDKDPSAVESVIRYYWESKRFHRIAQVITRFTKEELGLHFAKRLVYDVVVSYPDHYVTGVNRFIAENTGRQVGNDKYPLETITYYRSAASSPAAFSSVSGIDIATPIDPKIDELVQILKQNNTQVLVFCQFKATVTYVERHLRALGYPVFCITGDVPGPERAQAILRFKNERAGVLIMTAVGTEGLDLQFANIVVNYDSHWNPMVIEQRIGRVDRIGQEKSEVMVFNLRVSGSIDERVAEVVWNKEQEIFGTPFQLQQKPTQTFLIDNSVLTKEVDEAVLLRRSVEAMQALVNADLSVLPSIDQSFCNPEALVRARPLEWIKETGSGWTSEIEDALGTIEHDIDEATRVFDS